VYACFNTYHCCLKRMEDNPGEVTAETEEHYEELTKEVCSVL
jgi:hypothetical protein